MKKNDESDESTPNIRRGWPDGWIERRAVILARLEERDRQIDAYLSDPRNLDVN